MKLQIEANKQNIGFDFVRENKRKAFIEEQPLTSFAWDSRAFSVTAKRLMLQEQTRKMQIAKSIKWQVIRVRRGEMLTEQKNVVDMNNRSKQLVYLILTSNLLKKWFKKCNA